MTSAVSGVLALQSCSSSSTVPLKSLSHWTDWLARTH